MQVAMTLFQTELNKPQHNYIHFAYNSPKVDHDD